MKKYAKIEICPDCNTTLSFDTNLDKDIVLGYLQFLFKYIKESDNINDIKVFKDKLNSNGQ